MKVKKAIIQMIDKIELINKLMIKHNPDNKMNINNGGLTTINPNNN